MHRHGHASTRASTCKRWHTSRIHTTHTCVGEHSCHQGINYMGAERKIEDAENQRFRTGCLRWIAAA
eukprot:15201572-Alexandrium_andersonii.AAC.1